MAPKSSEQARRALAESVLSIARLSPSQKDEGVAAFNVFRRGIMQASTGDTCSLDDLLGDLDPKVPVFHFLVSFHEQKRPYRKQVASVVEVLLQVGSWLHALRGDEALCLKLPADLRSLLESTEASSLSRVAHVECAHVSEVVGSSEVTDLGQTLQRAAETSEMFVGHDADLASDSERLANSPDTTVPTSCEVRAAIMSALAIVETERTRVASKASCRQCKDVPEVELQSAVSSLLRCKCSVDLDVRVAAFEDFQRAVSRIIHSGKSVLNALDDIEPKDQVLEFCLDVHDSKKNHQKRVAATCRTLLQLGSWLRMVESNRALDAKLPASFRADREPERRKTTAFECFVPSSECTTVSRASETLVAKSCFFNKPFADESKRIQRKSFDFRRPSLLPDGSNGAWRWHTLAALSTGRIRGR